MKIEMDLEQTINDIHENAVEKGFWEDFYKLMESYNNLRKYWFVGKITYWETLKLNWFATQLALIHSEVSEMEEVEDDEHFAEELADVCIRTLDLLAGLDADLTSINERIQFKSAVYVEKNDWSLHWYITNALKALQHCNYGLFERRLVNIAARCFCEAEKYGVDLEKAIVEKMRINSARVYKHGKRL